MNNSLLEKAKLVRKWSLIATSEAGSGHPTSCLSAADLMTVLFDNFYHYDLKNPKSIANDRLIFSKGHAAPLLYTLYTLAGAFSFDELKTLRKFHSRLEGHPTPEFPYAEAATGSLGQGLSVGAGLAIGIKREKLLTKKPNVFVVMGDGELAEGQVWEAANFAAYYKLNNLIAIADINRLGQSQETMFGHNIDAYKKRFASFGWQTIIIDGHNMDQVLNAFQEATTNKTDKPVVIIAKTEKGKGISFLSNKDGWHGKPLSKDDLEKALEELGPLEDRVIFNLPVPKFASAALPSKKKVTEMSFQIGQEVATREVYGNILAEIGKVDETVFALDAEVKNSTYAIDFLKALPERFVECFIAEQNMVSVAAGLSRFGKKPFVSTFAAFLTRAADQIRMARLSNANIVFVGSHAGVSIGEDGASQMGLEDMSLFGTLPDTVIVHPSDAVSMVKLVATLAETTGISYLRTLRPKTPVLYKNSETFPIGGSKVLKKSTKDVLTIAACGITVPEALKAYDILQEKNVSVRVIDCYSIKPIDKKTLAASVSQTKYPFVITVEDHFVHGGFGDFVLDALAEENAQVYKMAVSHISHSGHKDELLHDEKIDAKSIVALVQKLLKM